MSDKDKISGGHAPAFAKERGELFGHPKGLMILFFTEMWERFSYYGLRGILVFFLTDTTLGRGGYGWSEDDALLLLGIYTALVYIMSIPGGILADKVFGQRKAVMYGGFSIVAGHFSMAIPMQLTFFLGLLLIIVGTGLLKPNISTLVGGLYQQGDPRRDGGFTIFYMGINVGALLASIAVGYVGERIGWHWGFSLAGFGMLLGQLIFITGQKHLAHVRDIIKNQDKIFTKDTHAPTPRKGFTKKEKDRILALSLSFIIVLVFFASFEQASGLMNLYARDYTDRMVFGWEVPASWLQGLNSFFIITTAGIVAWIWVALARKGINLSSIFKMGLGSAILGVGFIYMVLASIERTNSADGKSALYWLVLAYLFHTLGELALSPVSLSFITKVAPQRIVASMMGIYFAVIGLGNFLAHALIGTWAQRLGELQVFAGIAAVTILMGILLMILSKQINKLTHGTEYRHEEETDAQTGQLLQKEAS